MTHDVCDADGVEVGGGLRVLQVGQSGAEFVINSLSAVVVPLHIQQVGDHMNGCRSTQRGGASLRPRRVRTFSHSHKSRSFGLDFFHAVSTS